MKYDATLKHLFEKSARGLLRMLTGRTVTAWLNVEQPRVNVPRLDLLGRLSDGQLCNIEFETTNDRHLAERMGTYYLQGRILRDEDIEQIVLYLGKEPMRMKDSIDSAAMRFHLRLIDIRELDGDELAANGDLGDIMLAVLARVKSQREAIRRVLDRIAKLKGRDRELAIEQLAILAGLRDLELEIIEEARKYMPFVIDLTQNKIFQMRYQRGLEAGLEAGRVEGELKLLRALLQKRFGRLPKWAEKRIETATAEEIEDWSLTLLDAKTLQEVLGKPEKTPPHSSK